MQVLIYICLLFLLLYMLLIIKGPSIWDRLLGLNLAATKIVLIIIAAAALFNLNYLLDLAIVYEVFGFISTIFIALFIAERKKKGRKQ